MKCLIEKSAIPEQALTELESNALFILLDELEDKGWGYGFSEVFNCGVFTGPDDKFDLRLSMRTGEHQLQWSLTYPSTVGSKNHTGSDILLGHTLIWEYFPGATEQETEHNFLQAARKSVSAITMLPMP